MTTLYFDDWKRLHERKHGLGCDCAVGRIINSWQDERANLRSIITVPLSPVSDLLPKRTLRTFLRRAERILG